MDDTPHIPILRKTGQALVAVGVLDIGLMIFCIATGRSYSSSLNVFAVVAGVFLMRGSLKAADLVRRLAMFFFAASCAMALAWPFLQPVDLTLVQLRIDPVATLLAAAYVIGLLGLLFWVQRQLGRPPVLQASQAAGMRPRNMRMTAGIGVGLVALLAIAVPLMLDGETGAKAKSLAEQQLGAGYRYHVTSLKTSMNNQGTHVRATVAAWNEREVRTVPIEWKE